MQVEEINAWLDRNISKLDFPAEEDWLFLETVERDLSQNEKWQIWEKIFYKNLTTKSV